MCRGCKDDPEAAAKAIVADLTPQTAPAKAAEFIAGELPQRVFPESQFAGRGIVLAAGGVKYGVCAWVCVRALRHVGCTLPIEIWYRGNGERQRGLEDALSPYNVSWVDAFAVRDAGHAHARLNGWELKPFAIQWSRFAETLFIDADNVAVRDPAYLFDAPEYAEAGTVLWPDYARMAPSREAWDVFGLREYSESLAGKSERCVESGQVLLDKRRTWHCLTLANWYGERSRFFFRYVYGDKELFHLAWRRLAQPYAMPAKGIHTLQGTMCQHDFAGERVFQHRNFNKWNLTQNNRRPGFLLENECLGWIDELKAGWSPAADSFATSEDRTAIAAQDGRRYRYVREGKGHRDVELRGGTFVEGGARCERYWTIRDGRLRIAQQDGQLIMDLEPDGTGWTGRWLLHEKMPVRLERA